MDINTALRAVGNNANKSVSGLENLGARKADGKATDASAATLASNNEKVTLTSTASRLGQLTQQTNASNEVNAERVASLRAAIADGSYQPNPASIASRLMSFENQLRG